MDTAPERKLRKHPLDSRSVQLSHTHTRAGANRTKPAEGNDGLLPPITCRREISGDADSKTLPNVNDPEETNPVRNRTSKEAERTVKIALKGYYERGEVTDREYRRILQRAIKKVSFMSSSAHQVTK